MPYEFVLYEKRGRIAHITINRPGSLNALHPAASREMGEAFREFRDDSAVRVAILTGAGDRAFCAGYDLKAASQRGDRAPAEDVPFGGITRGFECWKPIIAAVNGFALGGGLELVLASDLAIAADNAVFGLPEPRVGYVAVAGGVHRLVRQLPWKHAMGMLLTGRRMGAEEALRLGLVNEIVARPQLLPAAERWANLILECAPLSVQATKQMAIDGASLSVEQAIVRTYSVYEQAKSSPDFIEGPRAFAEKRKPDWVG
ncbi:MAG: enoyl-CoA hydratase/isomerase family protein [Chloroflexi bacterium]|nr:enoyl-CoA hydratase/isomerase family protein [Chloroflexota bacterium]